MKGFMPKSGMRSFPGMRSAGGGFLSKLLKSVSSVSSGSGKGTGSTKPKKAN